MKKECCCSFEEHSSSLICIDLFKAHIRYDLLLGISRIFIVHWSDHCFPLLFTKSSCLVNLEGSLAIADYSILCRTMFAKDLEAWLFWSKSSWFGESNRWQCFTFSGEKGTKWPHLHFWLIISTISYSNENPKKIKKNFVIDLREPVKNVWADFAR